MTRLQILFFRKFYVVFFIGYRFDFYFFRQREQTGQCCLCDRDFLKFHDRAVPDKQLPLQGAADAGKPLERFCSLRVPMMPGVTPATGNTRPAGGEPGNMQNRQGVWGG